MGYYHTTLDLKLLLVIQCTHGLEAFSGSLEAQTLHKKYVDIQLDNSLAFMGSYMKLFIAPSTVKF